MIILGGLLLTVILLVIGACWTGGTYEHEQDGELLKWQG
jgi:hypothetical protein